MARNPYLSNPHTLKSHNSASSSLGLAFSCRTFSCGIKLDMVRMRREAKGEVVAVLDSANLSQNSYGSCWMIFFLPKQNTRKVGTPVQITFGVCTYSIFVFLKFCLMRVRFCLIICSFSSIIFFNIFKLFLMFSIMVRFCF